MPTVLLPGRHILNTRFQEEYLLRTLRRPIERLPLLPGSPPLAGQIDRVVFAVTSANQCHSRYNPVPIEVRCIGVDRFARRLKESLGVDYRIVPVPHFNPSPRFAEFLLKEIREQSEGTFHLTPADTVVLSSTPLVIRQFQQLGFGILPCELSVLEPAVWAQPTPNEVLLRFVAAGEAWAEDEGVRQMLAPATFSLWQDFPNVPRRIFRLYRDPLLNDQGSLTELRDYSTYAAGMNERAALRLKYDDIRGFIVPGKIVDEGCADGALLVPIAHDYPDSDLIGIEITGEFLARCVERQRALEYGGSYVHFHQRNITEPIFEPASIDTTICNSTTHELWSYGEQAKTVRAYLAEKFRQTRPGGRILIRDVVGPPDAGQEVWLWCAGDDGADDDAADVPHAKLAAHLAGLSTRARFRRFARDYLADLRDAGRRDAGTALRYREEAADGRPYFVLRLKDAAEFMTKKDYCDNWRSEMNEEFAFWSFEQWTAEVTRAGFDVLSDAHEPEHGSRAYVNPWLVANRFDGKVELYRRTDAGMERLPYPVTNMVLVGTKQTRGAVLSQDG